MNEQRDRRAEDITAEINEKLQRTRKVRHALLAASAEGVQPRVEAQDIRRTAIPHPQIELGLSSIDCLGERGVKGFSIIGGEEGVGKSPLMLGAALIQAQLGVTSIVLDAENDPALIYDRVRAYFGEQAMHMFDKIMDLGLFHWVPIDCGQTMRQVAKWIEETLRDERCLIGADSITSIARMLASEPDFDANGNMRPPREESKWIKQEKLALWMRQATRKTNGNVAFLGIAELNKEGEAKGRDLGYLATGAYLTLHREDADDPTLLRIKLRKNRSGPVDLGGKLYRYHWESTSFKREDNPDAGA